MKKTNVTPQRLFGYAEQCEINFQSSHYDEVWCSLLEAIGEGDYFNGCVETSHEGFTSLLTTTLIVYRDRHNPEQPINRLIPIWWEMATLDEDDNEHPNDFSLKELLELKIES